VIDRSRSARPACSVVHDSGRARAGAPVVLVHGVGGHARQWPPEVLDVGPRRVIAVDLPGHGSSASAAERSVGGYARAVVDLLDSLDIPAAIVAGHSMGGAIALTLGLDAPGRIAGLVLVATGARLRCTPVLLEDTARPELLPRTARAMAESSFGRNASEAIKETFTREMAATPPGLLHAGFSACDAFDVMDRLGEIRAPALVVCGDDDRLTPPKYSQKLATSIPAARLVVVPGAGHMVMVEEPALVARAMAEFLERL
jgi:pimeloyl-ACP methyl ester carboxylesterase